MKKVSVLILSILFLAVFYPLNNSHAADDLGAKIDKLQKQLDDLKAEKATTESVKTKMPLEVYGFAVIQGFWGTNKTQMYNGSNSTAAQSRVTDKTIVGQDNAWFSLTPQNSRIGLRWTGTDISEKLKLSGVIELDFLNVLNTTNYGTAPIPRLRLFYFNLSGEKWSVIAGQNWDIFSPLNTNTWSLGGNLWFQGNLGFRRPQVSVAYNTKYSNDSGLKFAASVNNPANTDDLYNGSVDSGVPMFEGLAQYTKSAANGDYLLAVSGVGGPIRQAGWDETLGIAGSVSAPLHKYFILSGEIQYGKNMGNLLSYAGTTANAKDLAIWGQIQSKWFKKLETNTGYGIDNMQKSKIAAGSVTRNQVVFANFKLTPVRPLVVGIEYQYMKTAYQGNGSSSASIVFTNILYNF